MASNQYTPQNYERDRKFAGRCSFAEHADSMGKLEVLLDGPGSKALFMDHDALPSKFLSMRTAYNILENEALLFHLIFEAHPNANLPGSELKQWRDECLGLIHRRVESAFGQRYRGAAARAMRYERRLVAPLLNELRKALRVHDAEQIYELAERIGIMTESWGENHPMVQKYRLMAPRVEENLSN